MHFHVIFNIVCWSELLHHTFEDPEPLERWVKKWLTSMNICPTVIGGPIALLLPCYIQISCNLCERLLLICVGWREDLQILWWSYLDLFQTVLALLQPAAEERCSDMHTIQLLLRRCLQPQYCVAAFQSSPKLCDYQAIKPSYNIRGLAERWERTPLTESIWPNGLSNKHGEYLSISKLENFTFLVQKNGTAAVGPYKHQSKYEMYRNQHLLSNFKGEIRHKKCEQKSK